MSSATLEATEHLKRHSEACREAGITRVVLTLSFDCDTREDAQAALDLLPALNAKNIPATFAVPGAQLLAQPSDYRALAALGGVFINHGAKPHAEPNGALYRGVTFYNEMSTADVVLDIMEGHRIVREVLGIEPEGFRAPHFGCFQNPDQLRLIHETARKLGYSYCSTTLPALGLERGGLVKTPVGLWELPVSGSLGAPDTPLDSWNYLANHDDMSLTSYVLKPKYREEFLGTVDFFLKRNLPAVLNYYVDPAHVAGSRPFLDVIDSLPGRDLDLVSLSDLAGLASRLRG